MSEIKKEIKDIEKAQAELAKKKQALLDEEKKQKAAKAELEALFKKSGYASPRKLVEALVEHYGLRMGGKKAGSKSGSGTRRPRTRITADLRDKIKADIKAEGSVNAVAKKTGISYLVVSKIHKGAYDKIK